jgi:hypothetical protein
MEGDLAFLGLVRLPRLGQSPVLLICGLHALGSLGIATFLESEDQLNQLMTTVVGQPFYAIIRSRHSSKHDRILETDIYLNPRVFH